MTSPCPYEGQSENPLHHACKDCREALCGDRHLALHVVKSLLEDEEAFIARLSPENLAFLGLKAGDDVWIKGKKEAVVPAGPTPPVRGSEAVVHLDPLTQENAGTFLFDKVILKKPDPKPAQEVRFEAEGLRPFSEREQKLFLEQWTGRTVLKGNRILFDAHGRGREILRVRETLPEGPVRITPQTVTVFTQPTTTEGDPFSVSYRDIGGLDREIERIREIVELPLKYPEVFARLGIEAPKGILLHGPPGSGKTLIAKAVARETRAAFFPINGPEIMQRHYGESEEKLRSIFEKAQQNAPAIIFLDEIDSLAPRRDKTEGEVEKRIVAQLLSLMDGLKARGQVIVMGATNIPNALDPALRRPGRFDREIAVPVPDEKGRLEILSLHSRRMPLADDVDLREWSRRTHGFVGADLKALCQEAGLQALRRIRPRLEEEQGPWTPDRLKDLFVENADFEAAFKEVEPSAIREVQVELPQVGWKDIGGLKQAKRLLQETFEWPLRFPERYARMKIKPPKGVLITGPPGTGKTLLVQALARESGLNFISVKGPELLSKYVGESEERIRELFHKARLVAPSILFFDEIDSFAAHRGLDLGTSRVTSRMVSQLLTEMDGIEKLKGVFILGATSRPEILDPALLRPGRFEVTIELSLPDREERLEILKIHLKDKPLAPDVDLEKTAERMEGWSGAQIEALCRRASLAWFREGMEQGRPDDHPLILTRDHFEKAWEGNEGSRARDGR